MINNKYVQNILGKPILEPGEALFRAPETSLDGDYWAGLSPEEKSVLFKRQIDHQSQALQRAAAIYRAVRFAGYVNRYISWLFHQPIHLIDALEIIPNEITAYHLSGLRSVSISRITASKRWFSDFDFAFCPLNDKHRTRWINIAATTILGAELPAVDLLQIDNTYIVCDGHNHISVARALGYENIDAYVTKLQYPSKKTFGNRS